MLITPVQNTNSPRFCGLTKQMKNRIFIDGKKDICEILNRRNPQQSTIVCQLPPFIFNALPKENRPKIIKEFFQTFADTANEIRPFIPDIKGDRDEYLNRRPKSSVNRLKNLFQKYNLLDNPNDFDITYLGSGEYKKSYKLVGIKDKKANEELCFKVFHLVDKTPEWHKYKSHGNYAEINIDAYWRNREGQETQRGKFYCGDINNGYSINRFIDDKVSPPKRKFNEYNDGVKITDEFNGDCGHNKLYGYSIDCGGSRVVNRIKNESKTAMCILNRIKKTPYRDREVLWYKLLSTEKHMDDTQKKAGLALCIRHIHFNPKEEFVKVCLDFNKPLVDQALGYALKYLPEDQAEKYFEILMKRKDPTTQTVLLNEIPLLSRERLKKDAIDDLDVPRGEIDTQRIKGFYEIAKKHVLPEVEEHLANYVHLLPQEFIMPEADRLIAKNNYHINDRFIHKIKFVKSDQFPSDTKKTILDKIEKTTDDEFLQNKIKNIRVQIIRDSLDE